jgi:hypothetical protein
VVRCYALSGGRKRRTSLTVNADCWHARPMKIHATLTLSRLAQVADRSAVVIRRLICDGRWPRDSGHRGVEDSLGQPLAWPCPPVRPCLGPPGPSRRRHGALAVALAGAPLRPGQRQSAGAKSAGTPGRHRRTAVAQSVQPQGVHAPAARLSEAGQNPSRAPTASAPPIFDS